MADLLYTDKQDAAVVQNLANEQVGTAPDGRPQYILERIVVLK